MDAMDAIALPLAFAGSRSERGGWKRDQQPKSQMGKNNKK